MSAAVDKTIEEAPSRRRMLGIGRMAAAAGVSMATLAAIRSTARAEPIAGIGDADIFNFALNFEYLGAEYYTHAVLGYGLSEYNAQLLTGSGTQGSVTPPAGATQVPFVNEAIQYFAIQLATDEIQHVQFIRAAIQAEGGTPIAEPSINLDFYTNAMIAAGVIGAGQTFNPYASETNFLLGAYLLEDTCVTALAGAANVLSNGNNLAYAAGLLGVESQQAGAIRGFLAQFGFDAQTDAISTLRASLSQVEDEGTGDQNNPFNISNGDSQAQAYRRTPAQVLAIAYAGRGLTAGGFFPAGVNASNPALASS